MSCTGAFPCAAPCATPTAELVLGTMNAPATATTPANANQVFIVSLHRVGKARDLAATCRSCLAFPVRRRHPARAAPAHRKLDHTADSTAMTLCDASSSHHGSGAGSLDPGGSCTGNRRYACSVW